MKKKIWLCFGTLGIAGLMVCALVWQYGMTGEIESDQSLKAPGVPKGKKVDVACPRPMEQGLLITLPGRARASRQADLFFRVSGPLFHVMVKPGDWVKKGDLMLQLDDRDYGRQVRAVETRLRSARANLLKMENGARPEDIRIIESSLKAARADLALAQKEFKRYETLLLNAAVSQQAYDRAENSVKTLKARTVSLEQQLSRDRSGARKEDILAAKAGIEGLEVELAVARDRLEDTRLVAPFDGVVTSLVPEAFEMVTAGHPVLTLDNIATIEIPVNVPENQVHLLLDQSGPGSFQARFLTARSRLFEAKLSEYAARADQASGTYEFVFSVVPDQTQKIFPGMTAEIYVYETGSDQGRTRLVIPLQSLTGVSGNSAQVFLVDKASRTARKQGIQFQGLSGKAHVVVLDGLTPKDLIVTGGASFIRPGQVLDFELPN